MLRTYDGTEESFIIGCSIPEFVAEWKECVKDKTRSLARIREMIQPYFDHWQHMLTTPGCEKNFDYMAWLNLVSSIGLEYEDVHRWIEYESTQGQGFQEIFEDIFFTYLGKNSYYAGTLDYIVVRNIRWEFRRRLQKRVRKYRRNNLDELTPEYKLHLPVWDSHRDYLFLRNAELSDWEHYIIWLRMHGASSPYELSDITKMCRKTIYLKEKKTWHNLKKSY